MAPQIPIPVNAVSEQIYSLGATRRQKTGREMDKE